MLPMSELNFLFKSAIGRKLCLHLTVESKSVTARLAIFPVARVDLVKFLPTNYSRVAASK
jgi:hypothetical protein